MDTPSITERIHSPHQSGRGGHTPLLIVNHIAEGTYGGTQAWFAALGSQTSSHYIVARDGRICQCVPLNRMAWCNGTTHLPADRRWWGHSPLGVVQANKGNANQYSVSIEYEGFYSQTRGALTAEQLDGAAWLHQHIRDEVQAVYGSLIPFDRSHIVGHFEVNPKTKPLCPGERFPWDALLARLGQRTEPKVLYRVQLGAFTVRENARRFLRDVVLPEGMGAFITPPDREGICRVQIGAFSIRANAEAYVRAIREKGWEAFLAIEGKGA